MFGGKLQDGPLAERQADSGKIQLKMEWGGEAGLLEFHGKAYWQRATGKAGDGFLCRVGRW